MSRTKIIDTLTFIGAIAVLFSVSYVYLQGSNNPTDNNIFLKTRLQTDAQDRASINYLNTCDNLMGLNIDPFNPPGKPSISDLQTLGVSWLRIEWRANNGDYEANLKEFSDAGYNILFIVDYASMNVSSNPDAASYAVKFEEAVNKWDKYIDAYEIWNEPDLKNEHYVSPSVLADMTKRAKDVLNKKGSKAKIITGGGLASGDVSYLTSLMSSLGNCNCFDAIGVHPYLQAPDGFSASWTVGNLRDFFSRYSSAARGKPLWITEIGNADSSKQADYLYKFYQTTKNTGGASKLFWFAYSDGMVSGYGLKTAGGERKASYDSYVKASKDFAACSVTPEPSTNPTQAPSGSPSILPSTITPTVMCPTKLPNPNPELCNPVSITSPPNGSTLVSDTTFRWCQNPSVDCPNVKSFTLEVYNYFENLNGVGDYVRYDWDWDGSPGDTTYLFEPKDLNGEIMTMKLTTYYKDGKSCMKIHTYKKGGGSVTGGSGGTVTPIAGLTPTPIITGGGSASCSATGANFSLVALENNRGANGNRAQNPDTNLGYRGFEFNNQDKALQSIGGPVDTLMPPNVRTMLESGKNYEITRTASVANWANGVKSGIVGDPAVTMIGIKTDANQIINALKAGRRVADTGENAVVMYADTNRLTLNYTADDNAVHGYSVYYEGVCVDPKLLSLYKSVLPSNSGSPSKLPGVTGGSPIGRAVGSDVLIVIRDSGMFMDTRSKKDWWDWVAPT